MDEQRDGAANGGGRHRCLDTALRQLPIALSCSSEEPTLSRQKLVGTSTCVLLPRV